MTDPQAPQEYHILLTLLPWGDWITLVVLADEHMHTTQSKLAKIDFDRCVAGSTSQLSPGLTVHLL